MTVPIPKSQMRHPVRAGVPLPLQHIFFDVTNFYKILPPLPIVITKSRLNASGISSDMLFSCRDWRQIKRQTDNSQTTFI